MSLHDNNIRVAQKKSNRIHQSCPQTAIQRSSQEQEEKQSQYCSTKCIEEEIDFSKPQILRKLKLHKQYSFRLLT